MDQLPAWAPWLVALVLPSIVSPVAAGMAWVVVRAEAGGGVRWFASMLAMLGQEVVLSHNAPLVKPRPGVVAWLLRLPERLLGCAGCTSWWLGGVLGGAIELGMARAAGAGLAGAVGAALLAGALSAFASARAGSEHDAKWLAMVLTAERARIGTDAAGHLEDAPDPNAVIAAAMAGAAQVVHAAAAAGDSSAPVPVESFTQVPMPSVPSGSASLHPTSPVPQVPSDVASA